MLSDGESRLASQISKYQLIVIAAGVVATLLITVAPFLSFGYRNNDLHTVLETAASIISALAAYIIYGRYRRSESLSDLALATALWLLALANVAAALAPAFSESAADGESVWMPLWVRLLAGAALAGAAFAPERRSRRPELGVWVVPGGIAAAVAVVALAVSLGPHLATGIDPALSPADSEHPRVIGSTGLLGLQGVAFALAATASVGFSLRARRTGDELLGWLALAATVAAFSRLNYFLFPSVYSGWVFTGDFLRLGFYSLILIGALRQIAAYQRQAAEAAVLEERRRIARDLHDGLAQDLAFISMQASRLTGGDDRAATIAEAADHALADSRGAIVALSPVDHEPLGSSVARLATALTQRSATDVDLEIEDGVETSRERREAILRILSEAISNVTRHASASRIVVRLSTDPCLRLAVLDDGIGFDPSGHGGYGTGFGLRGMSERASQLGGGIVIRSAPGKGTEVEVMLP